MEDSLLDTDFFKRTIIGGVLLLQTTLNASSVEALWQKHYGVVNRAHIDKNPQKRVQEDMTREINRYLLPRKVIDVEALIPEMVIKPIMPPEVQKPVMAQKIELVQGKYEKRADFEKRLQREKDKRIKEADEKNRAYKQAIADRNEKIAQLSREYKRSVKARNERIAEIQIMLDKDRVAIKNEQLQKKKELHKYLPIFFKNAYKKYFSNPYIVSMDYFVDSGIMEVVVASRINGFKEKLEFKVEPSDAEAMDNHFKSVEPKLYYLIDSDEKSNSLSIRANRIVIEYDNKEYLATPRSMKHVNQFMHASIDIDDPTNVSIEEQSLDLQTESLSIAYQEANVKEVTYRVTTASNNDILNRLSRIKAVPKNPKNWLFVLGIEHYANEVDPIAYSKQSALSFAKVAQKLLGVEKENSFVLVGDKTTSGQIKSDFRQMLSLVKEGDSIYFYYSGHGIPVAIENNEPYMLAKDINPAYIDEEKFFKLKNIYAKLSNSKASKVIAVIDSCFSGSTDGVSVLKGIASARLVPKKVEGFNQEKMVVLSAGRKKQYSNMYKEKEQRLFSYFVMNALLENDKEVSSLYKDVYSRVERESRKMGNLKLQQPTILGNKSLRF